MNSFHEARIRAARALSKWLGPDWPFLAAVLLVALIAAWPAMSQPGLLNTRGGGDSPFLLQRLHQLTAALAGGHFPVRWMPDANYGYGYPFYNYYAPLSIYIAAAFRFLGFSFVRAIHLAQLAGFAVAGLGTFYLGRRWLGSRWAGLLAAVAYTVAPFHMVNVYVRGDSLAEFWAMAFYPWVLLAADGVLGEKGRKGEGKKGSRVARPIALFALAYAGLILSHNISALIFSPFLAIYLAVRLLAANRQWTTDHRPQTTSSISRFGGRGLWSVVCGLLLAFALAAWFFVPALAEQGLTQLATVTEGYFHYSNHFRGLDLVQGSLLFDYNPDGGVAFRLGLLQAGLAAAGAAVLFWVGRGGRDDGVGKGEGMKGRRGEREKGRKGEGERQRSAVVVRRSSLVVLFALVAVLMITPVSRPLWDHLPLLPFTQFPWRFLSVASFFMALLAGGLVLVSGRPAVRAAIAVLGSLVLLAAGLLGLRTDHLILTDADVTAERLAQYEWFTGNIGTTVSAEYLTPATNPRPWTSAWLNTGERDRVVATAGMLQSAGLLEREAAGQSWRLVAGAGGADVLLPTLYWPGWRASIDGQPAELRAFPTSGLMALAAPAGEHTVTLELGRTPVRLGAELVSLAALIGAIGLVIRGRATDRGQQATSFRGPLSVVCGLLFLAAFALLWRDDPRQLPPDDLTWDFAQMAYLHHDISGVGFDNGARLHQYGYSAEEIATGETLTVTLSVEPGDGGTATLALVTPASARPTPDGAADPPVIAAATQPFDGQSVVFTLPIPPDAPPGLYAPRLTIDGARPLMPSGGTRGDLFLRPVQVADEEAGEQGGKGEEATGALDVRATGLTMRDATTLDGRFAWYTARPLGARYQFSWRLQDPAGGILAQLDAQPGYGYQPTDGWQAGAWVSDWLALRLPEAAPAEGDYPLVMRLYDVNTGATLLMRRVGALAWDGGAWQPRPHEASFALPDEMIPMDVTFGGSAKPSIALRGYRLEHEPDALRLTLYWQALADGTHDNTRFVHLLDAGGAIAAQIDSAPLGDSYPTSQWTAEEVVADTVSFDLANLPPGEYRLATGFYQPWGDLRPSSAFGPDGPLPDGRLILPETIIVPER